MCVCKKRQRECEGISNKISCSKKEFFYSLEFARITSLMTKASVQRVSEALDKKAQAGSQPNKMSVKDILGKRITKQKTVLTMQRFQFPSTG